MNYLLDTNVISELVSSRPSHKVINWLEQIPIPSIYLSVLTYGEIRKGIEKVSDVKRKKKLIFWLEHDLNKMFEDRILQIDLEVSDRWGRLLGQMKRTLPAIDSLIAATALHHDLTLVTRNVGDFEDCPSLELLNPWEI